MIRSVWGVNMFEGVSDEEKLKALLRVVRNLIKNSRNAEIFKLEEFMKESKFPVVQPVFISKAEIREKIKEEVKAHYDLPKEDLNKEKLKGNLFESRLNFEKQKRVISERKENPVQFRPRRVLRIPKISLPQHLSSIRPVASEKTSIDLGKLNPLIQDSNVLTIETDGENEIVYVTGSMGRKPTTIKLSKEEIDEVINRFSNLAKIPKSEGLFKVAVGILLLTATISESVSSRFVIEKIKNKN